MKIRDIRIQSANNISRLSAQIEDTEVWFECKSGHNLHENADVFIIAALLPAMQKSQDIYLDSNLHVSPQLLSNLDHIQEIFALWYSQLNKVQIHAKSYEKNVPNQAGVGSFFSGGADGSYTFLAHENEITHLIFVEGVDIQLDNENLLEKVIHTNSNYVKQKNKEFVRIRSNIRKYITDFGISWVIGNGAGLSCIAHALAFNKIYFAGSHSALGLFPWGSHPLIDPLFSNEHIEIIHDGLAVKRTEKIKKISEDKDTLNILRVCWQDSGYNCGKCEKCLRTMLTLRLLDIKTETFPEVDIIQSLKSIHIYTDAQELFLQENLELALNKNDKQAIKVLKMIENKNKTKKALKILDETLLKGILGKLKTIFIK